jgi:hypothetical protein
MEEYGDMKQLIWVVGGICAAAVGVIFYRSLREPDVAELAHKLEDAWADNHTAA